ncbi:T9SS type A sorting domain-containing protein [Oceanihabitans sp.]|nr:T9SS type A sorting domain-containing protein [Oceanihabitans sp.]
MITNAPRQVMLTYLTNTKILSLVFACLLCGTTANANANCNEEFTGTTPILDSNFENALIALNIDTNGFNGNILDSDALAVTTLFIGGEGIANLTGIEAFTNLVNLFAYNNNIITADFSQNTALELIDLENNKVSTLNIESNFALIELLVSNNHLTNIDVSNNIQLQHLSCNLNTLSALDVSANIELKVLRCYSNNLNSLNINSNLLLEMLFVSDNNLSTLDVTLLAGLDTLTFDNNNINSINLSNNTNLEYLGCSNNILNELDISANSNLTRILCNDNNLTAIDLSTATDLFLFFGMNNQIQSIDVSSNSSLRFFRAENNALIKLDIRNGENDIVSQFVATQNPNLSCVFVDDPNASFLADWDLDEASTFVEDNSDCETLSIKEDFIADFIVYPNPANGQVNISLNSPQASVKLYTIKGQLIFEKELSQGINSVNISDFSSGLYVVAIQSEDNVSTKKLVIN